MQIQKIALLLKISLRIFYRVHPMQLQGCMSWLRKGLLKNKSLILTHLKHGCWLERGFFCLFVFCCTVPHPSLLKNLTIHTIGIYLKQLV